MALCIRVKPQKFVCLFVCVLPYLAKDKSLLPTYIYIGVAKAIQNR